MKESEIRDYNRVNWGKLTTEWDKDLILDMMHCVSLSTDAQDFRQDYNACSNRKYTCTVFMADTGMFVFDFANRNRLRSKIKFLQKTYDNIVGSIIAYKYKEEA